MSALKVLTVSSETGGARNLAEVVEAFQLSVSFTNLCAKSAINVFKEKHFPYRDIDNVHDINDLSDLVRSIAPDAILSGRGIQLASPERMAVVIARKLKIPSVGVIDEWYDYKENYVDKKGDLSSLPDMVCCPDEQARGEAIEDGLPTNRLCVTGSPLFASVLSKPDIEDNQESGQATPSLANREQLLVVFISEVIQSSSAEEKKASSLKGDGAPGYDEHEVRRILLDCLEDLKIPCAVLEKIHPSACGESYQALNSKVIDWYTVREINRCNLFKYADLVVGMRSAALLEAKLLGVPVVSLQPGLVGPNRCTAARKELIPFFSRVDSFKTWLQSQSFPYRAHLKTRPDFACEKAASNVMSAVRNLVITR